MWPWICLSFPCSPYITCTCMVKYACEGLHLYSTGLRPELSCTCSYAMYDDPLPIQLPTGPQKEHCVPLTPHLLFSSSFNLNSSLTHICVQQTLFYDSQYSGFTIENSSACMVFELLRTWNSTNNGLADTIQHFQVRKESSVFQPTKHYVGVESLHEP